MDWEFKPSASDEHIGLDLPPKEFDYVLESIEKPILAYIEKHRILEKMKLLEADRDIVIASRGEPERVLFLHKRTVGKKFDERDIVGLFASLHFENNVAESLEMYSSRHNFDFVNKRISGEEEILEFLNAQVYKFMEEFVKKTISATMEKTYEGLPLEREIDTARLQVHFTLNPNGKYPKVNQPSKKNPRSEKWLTLTFMEETPENAQKKLSGAKNTDLVSMSVFHGHDDAGATVHRAGLFSSHLYMWKLYVDSGKFNNFN